MTASATVTASESETVTASESETVTASESETETETASESETETESDSSVDHRGAPAVVAGSRGSGECVEALGPGRDEIDVEGEVLAKCETVA